MNPILVWRIVAAGGSLLAAAGVAYGVDQHEKREQEEAANRTRLQQLAEALAAKEEEFALLRSLLGDKNEQVRLLAAEVEILRDLSSAVGSPG